VQDFLRPDVLLSAFRAISQHALEKLYCSVGVEQERILLTDADLPN